MLCLSCVCVWGGEGKGTHESVRLFPREFKLDNRFFSDSLQVVGVSNQKASRTIAGQPCVTLSKPTCREESGVAIPERNKKYIVSEGGRGKRNCLLAPPRSMQPAMLPALGSLLCVPFASLSCRHPGPECHLSRLPQDIYSKVSLVLT